jgi:hypothetical protein
LLKKPFLGAYLTTCCQEGKMVSSVITAASLIENKTLHWGLINLIMAIYEILIVGAASSRDDVTIGMKGAFSRLEAAPTRT